MRRALRWLGVTTLLCATAGCAGHSDFRLVAEGELAGPVSLSSTVLDDGGRPLRLREGLERVAKFEQERRLWGILGIGLGPSTWDVTPLANAALAEWQADAIVNLDVELRSCRSMLITSVVVVLPSCVKLTLAGDIARRIEVPSER